MMHATKASKILMKCIQWYFFCSVFLFSDIVITTTSLTVTSELSYTTVENIQNTFAELENGLKTHLLADTKVLKVKVDANVGNGKWVVPIKYHNGIYIGNSCDYGPRSTWLCTSVSNMIIEGIVHTTIPQPNNLPVISGNDHSRLFWIAGAKLKLSFVTLEKGRTIYGGSGLYILSQSIVDLFQVQFFKHTAKYAAALYMEASADSSIINVTQCTFKENLVNDGLQGGAVGIYGAGTNLVTLLNNVFSRNKFYAPNGKGQDVYKQSDSSILYDVANKYVSIHCT
jgi:hypothetical protein